MTATGWSRREFLGRAAAAAAGAAASGLWIPAIASGNAPKTLDPGPFPFGVASGDPLFDRVILWTRVTPRRSERVGVRWEIARDPGFRKIVRRGVAETDAERDHTVKVDVDGLDPGTRYFYRFESAGERSRPGRTMTAPERADEANFALASCQSLRDGYYSAWRHLAQKDVDFVLFLGDYIYEYGNDGSELRKHAPNHEIVSLTDYRLRYANYRSDADLRAAHAAAPFICIWDDHEVTNDRWRDGAENHQQDEGDYEARERTAYKAFFEWLPVREHAADPGRIYRSFKFGDLVDLTMIDTRQYRDEIIGAALEPNLDPALASEDRTILGQAQEKWLHSELASSRARWRLIGNQVMVAHLKAAGLPDAGAKALQDLMGLPKDGAVINPDQWDGYQFDRLQLLEHLRSGGIDNTFVVTGDIHTSWASELKVDPDDPLQAPVAAEFVCPSITSSNIDETTGAPPRTFSVALEAAIYANNPHIKYAELDSNGYTLINVTRGATRADWYYVEDVKRKRAKEQLAASWEIRDGDSTVRRAG